jgi:7,8-dihydroneopterin aldolase/epimerase/oxygenase
MIEITLRAMRFHALVGILPHERTAPQPIEVDLHVRVADDNGVIDYRALYAIVATVLQSGPIDYLEEIGDRVARGAVEHSPRIRLARVSVRKPHFALAGPLAYAEVVVERTAHD